MSREYAEGRIREALKAAKGNATKARRQVMAWAAEDQRLLMALAKPHLTGIIAYAVSRVINRLDDEPHEEIVPELPQTLNLGPDSFGREILKALSNQSTPVFGREAGAGGAGRKQASQSHIDALKGMASKKKKK